MIEWFDIHVVPPSKKTSERIVSIGGRPSKRASAQYERATAAAMPQIIEQWAPGNLAEATPINWPIHMKCTFHVLYRSNSGNAPDLANLYHAPQDWLQPPKRDKAGKIATPGAGVIANDRLIRSHDGSRIVFECDGCADRKSGCNYKFVTRLKKDGTPWMRKGKVVRDKIQVCQRGRIEIELHDFREGE